MARVYETQTVIVDPNAASVVNLDLDKDFDPLEVAIITNELQPSGTRKITLGIVYNDAVTAQHTISLQTITVGNNIADISNVVLTDVLTNAFTEFIDHTISDDTMSVTILTISGGSADVNTVSTQKFQADPAAPITTGVVVPATGTLIESHLVNVGSLSRPSTTSFGAGTLNSVLILVAA